MSPQPVSPLFAILSLVVFTVSVGFTAALIYYFLFSKSSFIRKKILEKKINKIFKEIEDGEILHIGNLPFVLDKKNKKFIAL